VGPGKKRASAIPPWATISRSGPARSVGEHHDRGQLPGGAGSVVLRSVPANSTIVGVPGHIVSPRRQACDHHRPEGHPRPAVRCNYQIGHEVHELRQRFQQHSHETLGEEPNMTIDEGTSTPNISPKNCSKTTTDLKAVASDQWPVLEPAGKWSLP